MFRYIFFYGFFSSWKMLWIWSVHSFTMLPKFRRGAVQDGDTCEKEWTLSSQLDPPGMRFTWYVKYNLNSSKFNGCVIHAEELNFDHGIWWNSQVFEKAKAATLIEKTNPLGPEVLDSKHHHAAPKKQPQLFKSEHARNGPRPHEINIV